MELLHQPQDEPNCLVYAAAMIFNINPESIFNWAGHRGQEVWWGSPNRKRGFHIQEIIEYGLQIGYALVPIDKFPMSSPDGLETTGKLIHSEYDCECNFHYALLKSDAILISDTHAVAWNCEEILCYDPNGTIYGIIDFKNLHQAWLVIEIKSDF